MVDNFIYLHLFNVFARGNQKHTRNEMNSEKNNRECAFYCKYAQPHWLKTKTQH